MVPGGCECDGEDGGEAEGGVDADLLQSSDPEATPHQPLLGPAEEPFHAHPPLEQLHQASCSPDHEVLPHPEGLLDPGVPSDGDDGLRAVCFHCVPGFPGAVLGVGEHRPEAEA